MTYQVINPITGRATKIDGKKIISIKQSSGVYENVPQFIPFDKKSLLWAVNITNGGDGGQAK